MSVGAKVGSPSKRKTSVWVDLSEVLKLGWPNSVNFILTFLPGLLMLHFLGSDVEHVAGAGMGFMFSNVAGYSLIIGTGAGAQPLISQAFGASNFKRCGDLLQRQIAIHMVLVIFVGLLWLQTEGILLAFRQPPNVAALAGKFIRWRLAALPALALKEDFTNYLVAQRVMHLPMFASLAASLVNIAGFFVLIPSMGFVGAPLAYSLANILQAAFLGLAARWSLPEKSAWPQWDLHVAKDGWCEILKLALPGGILMLCEWWGWETNLFFAGLLCSEAPGETCLELDVFPIVANTMVIAFMPNYGFSTAAGALIGNALGANDVDKAVRLAKLALAIATLIGGSIAVALFFGRWWWGFLFSNNAGVVDLTARVLPAVSAYIFFDCLGPGALVSILRGMSVVALPACINFVAFYIIGIPVGLMLTFMSPATSWGLVGLWSGLVLGMFVMVSSLLVFLFCFVNWEQVTETANEQARRADEDGPASAKVLEEDPLELDNGLDETIRNDRPSHGFRNVLGKSYSVVQ